VLRENYLDFSKSKAIESLAIRKYKNKQCTVCEEWKCGKYLKIETEFDATETMAFKTVNFICWECFEKTLRNGLNMDWHGESHYNIVGTLNGMLNKLDEINLGIINVKQKQQLWKNIIVSHLKK
jgi:hypothetical protein